MVNPGEDDPEDEDTGEVDEGGIERAIAEGRVEEKAGFVTLRLESYAQDASQVWMEVAGTYPQFEEPMALEDVTKIVDNIRNAYDFLTKNGKNFLDQFDTERGQDNENNQ